jgi:hypothetical protein
MSLKREEDVKAGLAPIKKDLYNLISDSFLGYFTDYANTLSGHPPATQSHLIQLIMVQKAEAYFKNREQERIYVRSLMGRFIVNYQDVAVFCFKKFLDGLRIASNFTEQNMDFDSQVEMDELPAKAPHLYLGYSKGRNRFEMGRAWIACPTGVGQPHEWTWDITDAATPSMPIELPLESTVPETGKRLRIKGQSDSMAS